MDVAAFKSHYFKLTLTYLGLLLLTIATDSCKHGVNLSDYFKRWSQFHSHRVDQVVLLQQQQSLAIDFVNGKIFRIVTASGKVLDEIAHLLDRPLHNDWTVFGCHRRNQRNRGRARFHRCGSGKLRRMMMKVMQMR